MKSKILGLLAVGLLAGSMAAQATVLTYANRASFDAAVGSTTLIDFEAQQTGGPGGFTGYGSNLTVGNVQFTQADSRLYVLSSATYGTSGTTSYLNHNDVGSAPVVINFASGVYAVGLDIAWLTPWGGSGASMTFNLNTGDSFSTSIVGPLAGTSLAMGFVGFSSNLAISSITILDPSDSVMIDNFAYTNRTVPEPGTLALLGLGLLGLGMSRRKA